MKTLDHQLGRLLRAAAAAPPPTAADPIAAPDARHLLRAREEQWSRTQTINRSVFRVGLAAACALLLLTALVSLRHLEQANEDVFATSQIALTRISTP